MRIDAHQHYWSVSRGDYGWLEHAPATLRRDYLPGDLRAHLVENGIEKTVVVQAAPTVAETEFLLDLAEVDESIGAVVGWLDMEAEDFAVQLDRLLERPKFKGIRPMIQDLPDDVWMLRPAVQNAFACIEDRGCTFDFLTHPRHLGHVLTTVEAFPNLRCVVDHLSKPLIKSGELDPWRADLARVAEQPNVWCKLSGMVTEADHALWSPRDLRPYVMHAVDCFGWERVMFGSDWPVCLLAAEYSQVVAALRDALGSELTQERADLIFGENAARFYTIE